MHNYIYVNNDLNELQLDNLNSTKLDYHHLQSIVYNPGITIFSSIIYIYYSISTVIYKPDKENIRNWHFFSEHLDMCMHNYVCTYMSMMPLNPNS